MPAKRYGIRLIKPGGPNTPHTIPGLRGLYRADPPTPVGEPGDFIEDLDEARKAVEGNPEAEVVEIAAGKVDEAVKTATEDVAEARQALKGAKQDGRREDDTSRFKDEQDAVRGSKTSAVEPKDQGDK